VCRPGKANSLKRFGRGLTVVERGMSMGERESNFFATLLGENLGYKIGSACCNGKTPERKSHVYQSFTSME
jgi:hypothetical protein